MRDAVDMDSKIDQHQVSVLKNTNSDHHLLQQRALLHQSKFVNEFVLDLNLEIITMRCSAFRGELDDYTGIEW